MSRLRYAYWDLPKFFPYPTSIFFDLQNCLVATLLILLGRIHDGSMKEWTYKYGKSVSIGRSKKRTRCECGNRPSCNVATRKMFCCSLLYGICWWLCEIINIKPSWEMQHLLYEASLSRGYWRRHPPLVLWSRPPRRNLHHAQFARQRRNTKTLTRYNSDSSYHQNI